MVNPRSLIYALHTHWDVIESLVVLGRDFPSFEQTQVVDLIVRRSPGKGMDECEALLRQMVTGDLLQAMPRGTLQLDQDRHAILELTERAKSKDANLPIGRRYSEVLAAFDDYRPS